MPDAGAPPRWWWEWVAMVRAVWPHQELPDSTAEQWWSMAGRKWDPDIAQAAVVRIAEETERMPDGVARFAAAYHDVSKNKKRPAEPEQLPPEEKAAFAESTRRWWRVIHALKYNPPMRKLVRDRIGNPYNGWGGRVPAITAGGEYPPRFRFDFSPYETLRILEDLEAAIVVEPPRTLAEARLRRRLNDPVADAIVRGIAPAWPADAGRRSLAERDTAAQTPGSVAAAWGVA
jgi:hypothetical protein